MPVNVLELQEAPLDDLVRRAAALGVASAERMRRSDLVFHIARIVGDKEATPYGRGVLEVHAEGFGFLRSPSDNYLPGVDDIYVSQSQIRRFKLQTGDTVLGHVRAPKEGERYTALLRVELVNGDPPGLEPPAFDSLTAVYPEERLDLGGAFLGPVDWVAPIGLGQRGLLVAPSRTGRVELLRNLTEAFVSRGDLEVTVLLLDDRPEEILEWRKVTTAEVIATPFDETPQRHLQVTDIVFERARRMVERGDDVVVVVDSLTRLLRACMAELPSTGRDLGGVDVSALHRVRRYVGSARALEEGGSLTVIGVISGDPYDRRGGTGASRIDEALLDDLRDVVNWELTLSRDLGDRGLRPPIDVFRSGTRRVERLLDAAELQARAAWRASLTGDPVQDGASLLERFTQEPARPAAVGGRSS